MVKFLRFLAVLGCLTLAAGVAACGDKGGESINSSSRSEVSSSVEDSSFEEIVDSSSKEESSAIEESSLEEVSSDEESESSGITSSEVEEDSSSGIVDSTTEESSVEESVSDSESSEMKSSEVESSDEIVPTEDRITFKTLCVDGMYVYGEVSNTTEKFFFIDEVTVSGKAKFVVCLDEFGIQTVLTKTIPLTVGDNTVYVFEMVDDEITATYMVTIRRLPAQIDEDSSDEISESQESTESEESSESIEDSSFGYNSSEEIFSSIEDSRSEESVFDSEYSEVGSSEIESSEVESSEIESNEDSSEIKISSEEISSEEILSEESSDVVEDSESTADEESSEESSEEDSSSEEIEQEFYTEGLVFTLQGDNTYAVTGYTGTATEVVIPSVYDGKAVMSIGEMAFCDCRSLTKIVIPDSVTRIDDWAFDCCSSLTEIIIPDSVTSIDAFAFASCNSLTEIVIPDSVTSIADHAFYDCNSLTEIVIPDSVTSIGAYAFAWCSSLRSVTFGENSPLTSIGNFVFCCCDSLTEIVIPDSVTSIGAYAFSGCNSLTEIIILDSVTSIDGLAFSGCSSLTIYCETESQPSGWDSNWNYGYPVVWDCNNNEVADNGAIYKIIGGVRYALKDGVATVVRQPSNIKTANIFNTISYKDTAYTVTSIASSAFYGYGSLTEIVIPDSVTSIGAEAFYDCDSVTIYCEAESQPSGWDSDWSYYYPVVWDCNNNEVADNGAIYKIIGGVRYALKGGVATVVQQPSDIKTANITDTINYKDTVYTVAIGYGAFYYCANLTEIVIPDGITSIADHAFYGCESLTEVVLPDGVMWIGAGAFAWCERLTKIVIPDSVTIIGGSAFEYCFSLRNITFNGTMEEWNNIMKEDDWNYDVPTIKVVCTDGEIVL